MPLCAACQSLDISAIFHGKSESHGQSARQIPDSAVVCDLCALLQSALNQDSVRSPAARANYYKRLLDRPLMFRRVTDFSFEEDDVDEEPLAVKSPEPLQEIEIQAFAEGGFDMVRIALFAEAGSKPATDGVVQVFSPISDSGSLRAIAKVEDWLNDCVNNHASCRNGFERASQVGRLSSAQVVLPSRLLDLDSWPGTQDCRLCISADISDLDRQTLSYAALSHCWGSGSPLVTTRNTLRERMDRITFDDLPKTFQDATTVCRSLRIRYLWVDSLCILQGDKEDWKQESANMGRYYNEAFVTIAATGAQDGNCGLFSQRPILPGPVALPYANATDGIQGLVYAMLHPDQTTGGIDNSPLDKRAWITQEWLLSRRVVHYTEARLVWSCCKTTVAEDGEAVYSMEFEGLRGMLACPNDQDDASRNVPRHDVEFHNDWCDIVRSYCSRTLTYDSDKPFAIQGLANVLGDRRDDEYIHGMWQTTATETQASNLDSLQLFWYCTHGQLAQQMLQDSRDSRFSPDALRRPQALEKLPSWSWISTIGPVAFHRPVRDARIIADGVHLVDSTLHLRASVVPLPCSWGPVMPDTNLHERWPLTDFFSHASFVGDGVGITAPHGLYLLGEPSDRKGWASFDLGTRPDGVVLCCVVSRGVLADGTTDGVNVLLLQAKEGGTFERVGIGELLRAEHVLGLPKINVEIM